MTSHENGQLEHVQAAGMQEIIQIAFCLFAFMIPQLFIVLSMDIGWHNDDFYFANLWKNAGQEQFFADLKIDRPSTVYAMKFHLMFLPMTPRAWILASFFYRFIASCLLFALIRMILPWRFVAWFAAFAFAVFPGFTRYGALMYGITYSYFCQTLSIGSLILMIKSTRSEQKLSRSILTFFALLSGALPYWIYESALGLEVFRFYIIWLTGCNKRTDLTGRSIDFLRLAWPYVCMLSLFICWRLFLFDDSLRPDTSVSGLGDRYVADPFLVVTQAFRNLVDTVQASVFTWFIAPYFFLSMNTLSYCVSFTVSLLLLYLIWRLQLRSSHTSNEARSTNRLFPELPTFCACILTTSAVIAVSSAAIRKVELMQHAERFFFAAAPAICISFAMLLRHFSPVTWRITLALVMLAGASSVKLTNALAHVQVNQWREQLWNAVEDQSDTMATSSVVVLHAPHLLFHHHWEWWSALRMNLGKENPGMSRAWGALLLPWSHTVGRRIQQGDATEVSVRTARQRVSWDRAVIVYWPSKKKAGRWVPDGNEIRVLTRKDSMDQSLPLDLQALTPSLLEINPGSASP